MANVPDQAGMDRLLRSMKDNGREATTPAWFQGSRCITVEKTSMGWVEKPSDADEVGRTTTHHDDARHGDFVASFMTSRSIHQRALRSGQEESSV